MLAELDVGDVALFEVDDLVGHAGERHRVGSEEGLAGAGLAADAQDQRRALARADHAMRLVAAEHGDGEGAAQPRHGALHRLEQVAVVMAVDEVSDDLGIGLGDEHVAGGLQLAAQLVVVLDDPVVHQADPPGRGDAGGFARSATLTRGPCEKCGWALFTTGAPWVAQRVWAMPVPPCSRSASTLAASSATRAVLRARRSTPSWCRATPQES